MKIFSFCFKSYPHNFPSVVSCTCTLNSDVRLVNKTIRKEVNAKSLLGITEFNRNTELLKDTIEFRISGENENDDLNILKDYLNFHYNIKTIKIL
ncbi:hypothetical protein [Enterocloster phage PMBT24]|jgi:phosphotransferase system HPr-like phosphotransfer protein|uniref:Uncharacterized protein n=1 Tax=Enterocloster phage PMBT24 TaxID=3025413 RepID=A0AAT9TRV0_9CAUD|nr:hypothetical protein [Enterocloster phage PMBT24]